MTLSAVPGARPLRGVLLVALTAGCTAWATLGSAGTAWAQEDTQELDLTAEPSSEEADGAEEPSSPGLALEEALPEDEQAADVEEAEAETWDLGDESLEEEPVVESVAEEPATEEILSEGFEPAGAEEEGIGVEGEAVGEAPPQARPGFISIDFKDADIRQVLRIIAIQSGVDVVAGHDVEGLVTIKLTDVPWEQALQILLRTYGFTYERQGNIIRVMTVEALEQEALSTEVFPLNYATAEEVPDIIGEMLSDRGRVKFDARTNTVIVTDVPSNLFQIREVVLRLDQRTPQVLIDARIVETKLEEDENLGIEWDRSYSVSQTAMTMGSSFPFSGNSAVGVVGAEFLPTPVGQPTASSITFGTLTGPTFSLALRLLKKRSNTRILSNPSLAVLNNQEASIKIGEEFPVPTFSVDPQTGNTTVSGFEMRSVGTVLKVTPHVNPSRESGVDLQPEVSSVLANASFSVGGTGQSVSLPRFSQQTVQTQIRIGSGQTIAIGGLVKQEEVIEVSKVPILGDLPIIGVLFTHTHRFAGGTNPTKQQDLLIFLTVNLMQEEQTRTATAEDS